MGVQAREWSNTSRFVDLLRMNPVSTKELFITCIQWNRVQRTAVLIPSHSHKFSVAGPRHTMKS